MKTQGQYTLFETMDEFAQFIQKPLQRQITSVQNHHTAEPSYDNFTGKNHFERLKVMRDFHVNNRKFNDIAQNLTTFPDGTIAVCRPMDKTPAGIKGANTGAICIEHLGNFDDNQDQMTAAQRACILKMNALLVRRFKLKVDTDTFVYHHWFDLKTGQRRNGLGEVKSCPGTNFFGGNKVQDAQANFLPLIRQAVAALDGPVALPLAMVSSPDGVLFVRRGPAGDAEKLGELSNGTVVRIHGESGIWRRIDPVEQKWVSSKFLVPAPPEQVSVPIAVVQSPDGVLVIRGGPAGDTQELGRLGNGDVVQIHEINGIWRRIDGVEQKWVSSKFLVPG